MEQKWQHLVYPSQDMMNIMTQLSKHGKPFSVAAGQTPEVALRQVARMLRAQSFAARSAHLMHCRSSHRASDGRPAPRWGSFCQGLG